MREGGEEKEKEGVAEWDEEGEGVRLAAMDWAADSVKDRVGVGVEEWEDPKVEERKGEKVGVDGGDKVMVEDWVSLPEG